MIGTRSLEHYSLRKREQIKQKAILIIMNDLLILHQLLLDFVVLSQMMSWQSTIKSKSKVHWQPFNLYAYASLVHELANLKIRPLNLCLPGPFSFRPSLHATWQCHRGSRARDPLSLWIQNDGPICIQAPPPPITKSSLLLFESTVLASWGRRGVCGEAAGDGGQRQRRCKIPRKSIEETCLATFGLCVDRVESVPWRYRCDLEGNPCRIMVSQSELQTYFLVPLGCGAMHVLVHCVGHIQKFCYIQKFCLLGFRVRCSISNQF